MATRVSAETRQALESSGTALVALWGGPAKTRYYTPAGDEVWAIPSIREWVRKGPDGKVIDQGERDANLDRGWTLTYPAVLKLHCAGCDGWHETKRAVAACVSKKRASMLVWEQRARRMQRRGNGAPEEDGDGRALAALTARVEQLASVVEKLAEKVGGA